MLIDFTNGQTGVILRVKVRQDNTGANPGQGFTGLTSATSGLIVGTACDNETTSTAYTSAGSTIDTITTLGTYAAPTTGHCRIKEFDATNHPGLIEIHLANARYAVAGAKEITVTVSGVTGLADCDFKIPLRTVNPYAASYGLTLAKTTNITGFTDAPALTDYQQRAVAVTLPANPPGGFLVTASYSTTPGWYTPQTGDAYARLGAPAGASIAADIQTRSTYAGGAVASVAAGVTVTTNNDKTGYSLNLTQTGLSPRALDTVADANLTISDALVCAISGATGKQTALSTAYTIKTPFTGTIIRTFTLDSATSPTQRS